MKINVKKEVGGTVYNFEIDEPIEKMGLHKAIVLGNPASYCQECKNTDNFRLDSNKDKDGNVYVNVICCKCGAKSKMGEYKTGGYFWHDFEKYVKPGGSAPSNTVPPPDSSDIPF